MEQLMKKLLLKLKKKKKEQQRLRLNLKNMLVKRINLLLQFNIKLLLCNRFSNNSHNTNNTYNNLKCISNLKCNQ
jgi:hypothetical protein